MDYMNINQSMPQNLFQVLTKVSLDTLTTGDILKGRVQSLENGILLINLLDGKSFTAAVSEGFTANEGDVITLEIGQRQNNQLTAKILSLDSITENVLNKQDLLPHTIEVKLESLGVQNAKSLVDNVLELLNSKPELDTDQASFLVANKLSAAPDMDKLLLKISDHELSLHKNLQSLQDDTFKLIAEMDNESAAKSLTPAIIRHGADELSDQIRNLLPYESNKLADSIIQNVKGILTKTLMDEFLGLNNEKGDGQAIINKEILGETIRDILSDFPDADGADALLLKKGELPVEDKTMDDILKLINKGLRKIHEKGERIRSDFDLKEIKQELKKIFEKAFIKAENGLVEKIDAKEKSEALKEILELSKEVMSNSDNASKETNLPVLKEINTAFRFFEQVTTYNSVIQLPIKINQEETTGDLYVMKRKDSRRKIDTNNFTLFLSLSTKSLGLVESFLNSTNKRITIRFRLENEELIDLFNDNYRLLYDGLLEKGFTLVDMKCRLIDGERANILNASTKVEDLLGTQSRLDLKI